MNYRERRKWLLAVNEMETLKRQERLKAMAKIALNKGRV